MAEPRDQQDSPLAHEARTVARGRATRTPFVILGGVAVTVWAFPAALVLIGVLVWWLV